MQTDDQMMDESIRVDNAIEQALRSIKHVFTPYDDAPAWPEAWERDDKPFANVSMYADYGDPSVGIGGWSGLCLTGDQTGTVLGEILALRASPEVAQALLALCPYADPEDDPDKGRGQAALILRKALGL